MNIKDFISRNDIANLFTVLQNSWEQIEYIENLTVAFRRSYAFDNIILSGLGGSAIAGEIFPVLFNDELKCPWFVNRNYNLPNWANNKTLVLLSSYSGNTEETLEAFENAKSKGCNIICLGSGGTLKKLAEERSLDFVQLPKGFQPRFALYANLFALIRISQSLGIISDQSSFIAEAKSLLKNKSEEYSSEDSIAFLTAKNLIGFTPIIYGISDSTAPVAVRFKGQLNENSKVHAFYAFFPELNHNEIVGWETYDAKSLLAKIIYLKDIDAHKRNNLRLSLTADILKKKEVEIIELESTQKNFKLRIIDLLYLCDWISYHLAVMRNFDPGEIDFIMKLKELMSNS